MNRSRRSLFLGALAGAGALLSGVGMGASAAAKERVVKIQAKKFVYTPNEIVLKKGEPVVLEITSLDFVHGFNIPDMKIRADLPPGQVTRIRLHPQTAGVFDFLCDNFCGSGHEEMNGRFIVKG
jgi:cytochrome c oxidase subunit 2